MHSLGPVRRHGRNSALIACRHLTTHAAAPDQQPLLVVHPRWHKAASSLAEALGLAESLTGRECSHVTVGRASSPTVHPANYLGSGTAAMLQEHCQQHGIGRLFVNAALSGTQQRSLEAAVRVPVLDRVKLIISLFAQRARTREARLQVELASLEYAASRLVRGAAAAAGGQAGFGLDRSTEVVSARERGRSGSQGGGLGGAAGGGEAELQLQRRRLAAKRKVLQAQLEQVRATRGLHRAARRRAGRPLVAVLGYTNAGKSLLVQALTGEDTGVQDSLHGPPTTTTATSCTYRLFATLDPTARRVKLPSLRSAVLSDTVGFVADLPHQLVQAFRATLEEVTEADLMLHVLDASSPDVLQQREAVKQVLRSLGISEPRMADNLIEVWNKQDLLEEGSSDASGLAKPSDKPLQHQQPEQGHGNSVAVSAKTGAGLQQLLHMVDARVQAIVPPGGWAAPLEADDPHRQHDDDSASKLLHPPAHSHEPPWIQRLKASM